MTARSDSSTTTLDARSEPPTPLAQNAASPATMTVTSNLADDAIMASEMLVAPTAGSTALFANPYVDQREELLFVDIDGNLMWLTHDGDEGGWRTEQLKTRDGEAATAAEVAIAVHVDGTVWAFAIDQHHLRGWTLWQSPGGDLAWLNKTETPVKDARGLQVQYLPERPARPVVLYLHDHAGLLTLQSLIAMEAPAGKDPWLAYDVLRGLPHKVLPEGGQTYYGIDSPKGTARVYSIDAEDTLWYLHGDRNSYASKSIGRAGELAGIWHSPDGLGCVALHPLGKFHTIATVWPDGGDGVRTMTTLVDEQLQETSLWEDGFGQYHLYGLVDGALRVVHQKGLHFFEKELPVPAWESLPVTVSGEEVQIAVSRALTGSVDMYALDGFPDEFPSQHVMHVPGSVEAAERCVIMTQDVVTTWWSREVVRLPAQQKPYKSRMIESRLTLVSASGAVVSNCPVTITADRAADVRIGGAFFRCAPQHPVNARTDAAGTIRIATVAKDLVGATFHVTAVGLPDGTSFNPVTDLHKFLGGTGTLPAHTDGISETVVEDAQTTDKRWVFPAWHGTTSRAVTPTPSEFLRYCQYAYQATSDAPKVVAAGGQATRLREMVLQRWDPSRPAYEEVTTPERQAELAGTRASAMDDWDPSQLGDVFSAIGEGLVTVVETGVDWIGGTVTIVVEWVEGKLLHLKLLWDQSENPFQFIQAVVNELEADVEDVLDWLSWVFDWDDIIATRDAIKKGLDQLPLVINPQLDYVRDKVVGQWFAEKKEEIHGFFEIAREQLVGQTFGTKPPPVPSSVPLAGAKNPPSSVVDPENGLAPKTNWMVDWMRDHADGDFLSTGSFGDAVPEAFVEAADALTELLAVFDDDQVGQDFTRAVSDLESLVTNLFDLSDLQSMARTEIVTFLDMLEALVDLVLDLADAIVERGLTLIEKVIACIPAALEIDILDDTWIGWLWAFICEELQIEYSTPNLGDIFLTALAFPLTLVSKAVTGENLFPDGFPDLVGSLQGRTRVGTPGPWFPDTPERYGPEEYDVPPTIQAKIQVAVGVAQLLFTGIDFYMDSKNVAGSNDAPADDKERLFIGAVTTFDLIAFGLFDMPVFWGCNWMTAGREVGVDEGMWWGEYICKMLIYCGDFGVALLWPIVKGQPKFERVLGTMQGSVGNGFITALGLIELGFSIALCAIDGGSGRMAQIWLWSQTLSMLSSITAFIRILPSYQENPDLRMAKYIVDAVGDIGAGIFYTVMASVVVDMIPQPVSHDWPREVGPGPFEASFFASRGTKNIDDPPSDYDGMIPFDPPAWRFDDPDKVPPGLQLVDYGPGNPHGGWVKIAGTIPESAARDELYHFDLRCVNLYDPTMSNKITLSLKVNPT